MLQSSFAVEHQVLSFATLSSHHIECLVIGHDLLTLLLQTTSNADKYTTHLSHHHPTSIHIQHQDTPLLFSACALTLTNINGFPPQHRQAKDFSFCNKRNHRFRYGFLLPRDIQALRQRTDRVHKDASAHRERECVLGRYLLFVRSLLPYSSQNHTSSPLPTQTIIKPTH